MKKRVLLTAALILMVILQGAAAADLRQIGISILSTRVQEDGFTNATAQDESGLKFELIYKGSIENWQIEMISQAKKIISTWKMIRIQSLRIGFPSPQQIEISVIPKSFVYDGKDFARYMPSGLQFYYTDMAEYDFRILVDKLTLRIQGPYFTEKQLAEKLERAVENPIAYIQSHDPEHVARKLEEIDTLIDELKAGQASSRTMIEKLQDTVDTLTAKLTDLTDRNETLARNYENLKLAVIAVANQGLFSTIKDFDKDTIEKAIAVKRNDPSLGEEDLVKACKEQDIKIDKKVAHLIVTVFFSEF